MKAKARSNVTAKPDVLFRHILVPTDLTERTEKALQLAARLTVSDASRITLVHVIETIDGMQLDELKSFYQRLERKARAAMTKLAREAPAQHLESALVYGRRAEKIVKYATAHDVDLIVLASHRVKPSGINRDWGTISYKVGILAQCPVLLVK
jgi:universal stress protein A